MIVALPACGDDGADDGPALSPEAERGRSISRSNGCAACHGSNGEGGVGPPFAGLYGAQVALADGTVVAADEAFLAESIREPDATKVDGYDAPMPDNDLDDDEIEAVIAYIRELTPAAGEP
jgi:cytochrome c oxidase subunit 2